MSFFETQVLNDMILKQEETIEKEIQASHQLIDVIEEVKVLETQFCNDPTFLNNAIKLQVCLHTADKQFFEYVVHHFNLTQNGNSG